MLIQTSKMKFTIDRVRFAKMLRLVQRCMPGQKRRDPCVILFACAGRAFLSANATLIGEEALVLQDGHCAVNAQDFQAILATYKDGANLTFEAAPGLLRFRTSQIPATAYGPAPRPPRHFQSVHLNDTWLASADTPHSATGRSR